METLKRVGEIKQARDDRPAIVRNTQVSKVHISVHERVMSRLRQQRKIGFEILWKAFEPLRIAAFLTLPFHYSVDLVGNKIVPVKIDGDHVKLMQLLHSDRQLRQQIDLGWLFNFQPFLSEH